MSDVCHPQPSSSATTNAQTCFAKDKVCLLMTCTHLPNRVSPPHDQPVVYTLLNNRKSATKLFSDQGIAALVKHTNACARHAVVVQNEVDHAQAFVQELVLRV